MRPGMFCLAMIVLAAGCSKEIDRPVEPVAFNSPQEALMQVCATPPSHADIRAAVRALGWASLTGNQIPKQVTGNGMVTWTEVAETPDQEMLVAAGQLNGTSFCRVYSRQAPDASLQAQIEQVVVLGEPLGRPTFKKEIENRSVVGWHAGAGKNWRALHLSSAIAMGPDVAESPTMLEMTRPRI